MNLINFISEKIRSRKIKVQINKELQDKARESLSEIMEKYKEIIELDSRKHKIEKLLNEKGN